MSDVASYDEGGGIAISEAIKAAGALASDGWLQRLSEGAPFGPIERLDVAWTHQLTRSALVDLVASRSYVITASAKERAAMLDATRELEQDAVLREALGRARNEDYVDYFVATKQAEWHRYHEQVTQWELREYLTRF